MSNISQVKKESNWGDASTTINSNFQNLNTDLEKVKSSTTKFKGYFTSESSLKDKYPSPQSGDTAWVGEPYPGKVYDVQSGQWHNTNTAPDTGSVELNDYVNKTEFEENKQQQDEKFTELGSKDLGIIFNLEQGTISSVDGGSSSSANYVRFSSILKAPIYISLQSGYLFDRVGKFTLDGVFSSMDYFKKSEIIEITDTSFCYLPVIKKEDGSSILPSENIIKEFRGGYSQRIHELESKNTSLDKQQKNNSKNIREITLVLPFDNDIFINKVENISWKEGYYNGNGESASIDTNWVHSKIEVENSYNIVKLKNIDISVVGKIILIFFMQDGTMQHVINDSNKENYTACFLIPNGTTDIGISSRTNDKSIVEVYFGNITEETKLIISNENIKDSSLSVKKFSDYKEGLDSVKDYYVLSNNIANPKNWIIGKYNNGVYIRNDANYQYIDIDVSNYPVGTIFNVLKPDNSQVQMRYAGFFNSSGDSVEDFNQNVRTLQKNSEESVTFSCTIYKTNIDNSTNLGVFTTDVSFYEEYKESVVAVATWEKSPNKGNELARIKDVIELSPVNILKNKKWAVCGDSFSHGDFTGLTDGFTIEDGIYKGKNKVYGYLIGNRNNMIIQHMAIGGRTLATPSDLSFTNSFTYIENEKENSNYTQIDEDADYATFYFGINDSHHRSSSTGSDGEDQTGIIELGAINDSDNTTFYGAWNVMLKWLLENRPFTKLGIIVSNGCETIDYRNATIAIAKKWGIPYIDLNGDERTPMMLRAMNNEASSEAKIARTISQGVSATNQHPNPKAHEYESTFIENFLRSL